MITFLLAALTLAGADDQPTPSSYMMRTGNDVLAVCQSADGADQLACMAWVTGLTQGLHTAKAITSVCVVAFPSGSTNGQYRDIILRYLNDTPQYRHEDSAMLAAAALSKAFPCK